MALKEIKKVALFNSGVLNKLIADIFAMTSPVTAL